MGQADATNIQVERGVFKTFNQFMILLWRLGLGKWVNLWPTQGGRYMVIVHVGRKSGLRRLTPVNYTVSDGEIYCLAGFGENSDWYRNIQANAGVEVWLPDGWWAGFAEDATGHEDSLPMIRSVLQASGFAAKTFSNIDPYQINDQDLQNLTQNYRLIHIRRTEPRTGSGGPGDLAWIWPLSTLILAVLFLMRLFRR